ncbi:hypothetical protein SLV14_006994 [Streptomyces sp. Je 1-4]|uniref:hypothetical protein n=1 Tax=Streptomyces TaxID=1883 RepID=UPI0021DA4438|nr:MULTISPECIES: hypothetical protein [unclassified Streptomyces]UYB43953.1 hypothetical protein SLV14_006994 [Streptomyces sp. Je 1-4]UZQ40378.1 hypothetical protein SLV14N_006994 [Streptomyces sp. Je 1-4] [Streptomyces sp. Je 1-4 4N24]UZQ47795.1 hypothetical protein SLV14NA_006994 [Streptomyces sp. Je 1-4] [Streptomyces sp. Je 1-4 4N24_ara]
MEFLSRHGEGADGSAGEIGAVHRIGAVRRIGTGLGSVRPAYSTLDVLPKCAAELLRPRVPVAISGRADAFHVAIEKGVHQERSGMVFMPVA